MSRLFPQLAYLGLWSFDTVQVIERKLQYSII